MSHKPSLGFISGGNFHLFLLFFLPFLCTARSETADNSSRFTEEPKSTLYITPGRTVLLAWRYWLSHRDEQLLHKIELGMWKHGNIRTTLITIIKGNSTLLINSSLDNVKWLGSWDSRSAVFRLLNVTSSARYGCSLRFSGARRNLTRTVEILVRDPPCIVRKSSKTTVHRGARLVLLCDVQGDPKPMVTWFRSNYVLQNSTSKTNLTILRVDANVSGIYKCYVCNQLGSIFYEVQVSVILDSLHSKENSVPKEFDVPVRRYPQGTHHFLISFLPIALVFLILLAAYSVFNVKSKRTKALTQKRKVVRDPNDEQTMSLISDWANYEDNGEKL